MVESGSHGEEENEAQIGRYRIVGRLGAGGMARVLIGVHPLLNRQVAIKVMHRALSADPTAVNRFLREAQTVASLNHPAIVEIFDIDVSAAGEPFLVMELLKGQSLGRALHEGRRFGEPETLALTYQIASALEAAHGMGIVHRDLKPSNIFLNQEPPGTVKLLDFGIAKLVDGGRSTTESTQTGQLVGTPLYMSPEQSRGARAVDHRSDLYSLGCVMYELLTGRPPFLHEGAGELLIAHVTEALVPVRSRAPDVSPLMATIVEKLLAKTPDDRFASATALRDALAPLGPPTIDRWPEAAAPLVRPAANPTLAGGALEPPGFGTKDSLTRPVTLPSAVTNGGFTPGYFGSKTITAAAPAVDPASILAGGLPSALRPFADLFWDFLSPAFGAVERLTPGLFRLTGSREHQTGGHDCFALFMDAGSSLAASQGEAPRLGTRTFVALATPLEGHLRNLDRQGKKVVVVITDSPELGRGVREKIFEYRASFGAIVVPFNLEEIDLARRKQLLRHLFEDRLADLHTLPNPFARKPAWGQSLRFFGMRGALNELVAYLEQGHATIALSGFVGAGKSALLDVAEQELAGLRFCRLRCRSYADVARLTELLGRALENVEPAPFPPATGPSRWSDCLLRAHDRTRQKGQRLVLVLEDVDGLLEHLESPRTPEGELAAVRAFWTELEEVTRSLAIPCVVSGARVFRLRRKMLGGWHNALADSLAFCDLPRLDHPTVHRMLSELGAEGNVAFDEEAMNEVARLSGGNPNLVLRLAETACQVAEPTRHASPLARVSINLAVVRQAADRLRSDGGTFGEDFIPRLNKLECQVLRLVALVRPRGVRSLRACLEEEAPPEEIAAALELLRRQGVVEYREKRETVTIPLLAAWLVEHVEDSRKTRLRDRRIQTLGLGIGATVLGLGLYFSWIRSGQSETRIPIPGGCLFTIDHPRRVTGTEPVLVHVRRDCAPEAAVECPALRASPGTHAYLGARLDVALPDELCGTTPGKEPTRDIVLKDLSTVGSRFEFELRLMSKNGMGESLGTFAIARDSLANLKSMMDSLWFIGSLATGALLGLAAFFRDILSASRSLLAVVSLGRVRPPAGP